MCITAAECVEYRFAQRQEVPMRSPLPPLTRRALFAGTGGALGGPPFRGDSIARVVQAGQAAEGKTPADLSNDEGYWTQISRAFDVDRTLVNLNNGGCSPRPAPLRRS